GGNSTPVWKYDGCTPVKAHGAIPSDLILPHRLIRSSQDPGISQPLSSKSAASCQMPQAYCTKLSPTSLPLTVPSSRTPPFRLSSTVTSGLSQLGAAIRSSSSASCSFRVRLVTSSAFA